MAWVLIALYIVFAAPVRLGAVFRWEKGAAEGRLGAMVWGVRRTVRLDLMLDAENRPALRLLSGKRERTLPVGRPRKGARKSPGLRSAFEWLLSRAALRADIRIGGGDAALAALVSGALSALGALIPRARVRCRPRYGGESGLFLACIAGARLGTIIAVCLRGWIMNRLQGKKEEKAWIVPSGT